MTAQLCPTCHLGDGFHDRKVHDETVQVSRHLIITKEDDR